MGFGRFWARSVLALLKAVVGLDCEIRGLGNVPPGPCVIAMKHQSAWDTLILPVVLGDPAVVLKRELLWVPFYGWYASRAGSIAIDRGGRAAALRRMLVSGPRGGGRGTPDRHLPRRNADRAGPASAVSARRRGALSDACGAAGAGGGQFRAVLGPPQFPEAKRADHAGISRPDPAGPAAPPTDAGAGKTHRDRDRRAGARGRLFLPRGREPVLLTAEDLFERIGALRRDPRYQLGTSRPRRRNSLSATRYRCGTRCMEQKENLSRRKAVP